MTLPAIRPHQKTRLHLRDSTTVDFGPEGQTLTNDSVTVTDDVFTFTPPSRIDAATTFPTSAFSFSLWYKVDQTGSGTQRIIGDRDGTTGLDFYFGAGASGTVNLDIYDGSGTRALINAMVRDGEWHHLVAGRTDAGDHFGYLDGVALTSSGTLSHTATTGSIITVGSYPGNSASSPYKGDMADIRVVDYALTAGEVFDLYNEGRGFDLPERKQLTDTVVHVLDGSTDAGFYGEELTLEETTYANGVYTLSGTAPRIDMGQIRVLNEADGFAFSGWFKPSDVATRQFLWCHGTHTYVEINTSTSIRYKASDGALRLWAYTFAAGETYHIAVSNDGAGNAELWINGTSVGTVAVNGSSTFSFSEISINNASYEFQGDTWDNRVFDRPITAGEVANLYRKGIPALRDAEVLRIDPARYSGSGDLIDQTGNGNDLTLPSGYTVTDGVIVSDGTGNGPSLTSIDMSSSPGTIAFWIKTTDTTVICVDGDNVGYCVAIQDGNTGSAMSAVTNGQHYVDAVAIADNRDTIHAAIADGEWHHFAFTGDFDSNFGAIDYLFGFGTTPSARLTGEVDKLFISNTTKLTADQIAFLASSREFADPFPEPFLGLGGETLNIQPSRYSGNGDLLDESGGGNDLTLPGGYSVADGVISSDGTADGPDSGVSFASQTASIGVWVKTTDTVFMIASSGASEYLGAAFNNNPAHHSGTSNATTYIDGETGSYNTQSQLLSALNDGQWHHFAFTADFNSSWGNAQFFDYNSSSSWRFTGETDDLRIETGRKWSAEEVKLLASSRGVELPNIRDAKLYVSPSYDDASNGGTTAIDYSGNQVSMALANGPTWSADTSPDNGRRAIVFDSSDDLVTTDYSVPTGASVQSWTGWVYPTTTAESDDFLENRGTNASNGQGWRWSFYETGGSYYILYRHGGGNIRYPIPGLNQWIHLALIVPDGAATTDDVLVYVDNVLTTGVRNSGGDVSLAIANDFDARWGAAGHRMDDWTVHERQITPAEIAFFSDKRNPYGTPYTAPTPSSGSAPIFIRCLTSRGIF